MMNHKINALIKIEKLNIVSMLKALHELNYQ